MPVVLQSTNSDYRIQAKEVNASFIHKNSPTLLQDLESFIIKNFGFGDFIFRDSNGNEISRANNLKKFQDLLKSDTDILISNYWTSAVFSNDHFKSVNKKYHIPHTLEYLKKEHFPKYLMDSNRYKSEKKSMINFDKIICFSNLEKKVLIENYNIVRSKILSSSPGFDSELFFKIPKSKLKEKIHAHTAILADIIQKKDTINLERLFNNLMELPTL